MNITDALFQLRNNPQAFLSNNIIKIAGGKTDGVMTAYFGYRPGFDDNYFQFDMSSGGLAKKAGTDGVVYKALRVHNIRMNPRTEDFGFDEIPGYRLDNTGPDIMITGQLNACSFVVMEDHRNGGYLVSHLQPGGSRPGGAELRNVLRDTGAFGDNGEVTAVFGLGDYQAFASVIGVRNGEIWHIYGQRMNTDQTINGVTVIV